QAVRTIGWPDAQVDHVLNRWHNNVWGKGQGRHRRPRGAGSIVRAVGHAAGQVIKEPAFNAVDHQGRGARAVAGGDSPAALAAVSGSGTAATLAGMTELDRIADRVLLLHVCRPPAVLKIVDAPGAQVLILEPAEVDPGVRILMGEEWPGVQELVAVNVLPTVSRRVGRLAFGGQGVRRRTEAEDIEDQGFVVAAPPIRQESGLRLPSVRDGYLSVLRPLPIHATKQRVG